MTAVYPSSHNVFVRSHDASNSLVIDFARNLTDWAVNSYVQIVPVSKVAGYYLEMTSEEAGRILHGDLRNFLWPDGQPAPEGNEGTEAFEYKPFRADRRAFAARLGDLTIDQADWNILAQHLSIKARQAMTARTQLAVTALTTSGNYAASHRLDVTAISGNTGTWDASTTARQDIKRSLHAAAEVILDDTLNAVDVNDLVLVVNSALASEMSISQEIVDHIKGSPEALAQIRGELPGRNVMYGLPDKLYGFPVVVEASRKVTTKKGATTSRSQILATATPFMCARPGSLVGVADAPNFSTCVLFAQEEMSAETVKDVNNRRTVGRVVDTVGAYVVAPVSGVLFSNAS